MKFFKYFLYLSPIIAFVIAISIRQANEGSLGSYSNPIRFYFTPSVDASTISFNARVLTDYLHEKTGYYFTTAVPASYIAVVEAFGTDKVDVAAINTFSYLMANTKYGAEARLRVVRQGQTSYCGQIMARSDSGIDSLRDLNGKTFSYVDPSSTSGYILPKALFDSLGIRLGQTVFAMQHPNVVTMIYQRQVDAGAAYYAPPDQATGRMMDVRARVLRQFPDVERKIKIVGFTQYIPNDPIVFRRNLGGRMKDAITNALLEFVGTPEGKKAWEDIYDVTGLVRTNDEDYDGLRTLLQRQHIDFEKMVK
jgi:phosphonate transport system substrate-binding protein